jgi:hypothetical protein
VVHGESDAPPLFPSRPGASHHKAGRNRRKPCPGGIAVTPARTAW